MKKIIGIIITIMVVIGCITGCSNTTKMQFDTSDATYTEFAEDKRFMKIDSINGWIYVDKETKVQYLFVKRGSGAGLTLMVDSEGKPLLYEE